MRSEDYPPLGKVVYFMQAGDHGPIKIGFCSTSKAIKARVADLQTGCPWPIIVRRVIRGDRYLERDLHERFAKWRLAGEWFAPVTEVLDAAHATGVLDSNDHLLVSAAYERGYEAGVRAGIGRQSTFIAKQLEKLAADLRLYDELEALEETQDAVTLALVAPSPGINMGSEAA